MNESEPVEIISGCTICNNGKKGAVAVRRGGKLIMKTKKNLLNFFSFLLLAAVMLLLLELQQFHNEFQMNGERTAL